MSQKGQKNSCDLFYDIQLAIFGALAHDIEKIFRGAYRLGQGRIDANFILNLIQVVGYTPNPSCDLKALLQHVAGGRISTSRILSPTPSNISVPCTFNRDDARKIALLRSDWGGMINLPSVDENECKKMYDWPAAAITRLSLQSQTSTSASQSSGRHQEVVFCISSNNNCSPYTQHQLWLLESLKLSSSAGSVSNFNIIIFIPYFDLNSKVVRIRTRLGRYRGPLIRRTRSYYCNIDSSLWSFLQNLENNNVPFGHILTLVEILAFADKHRSELNLLNYRDLRLYGLILRPEEAGRPSIALGIHTALAAMIVPVWYAKGATSASNTDVTILHFTLFDSKSVITGVPYTFESQETGYLKHVRGISALLYAYTLAVSRAIIKSYHTALEGYYRFFTFTPTVSEGLMFLDMNHATLDVLYSLAGEKLNVELVLGDNKTRRVVIPFKIHVIANADNTLNEALVAHLQYTPMTRWSIRGNLFFRPVKSQGQSSKNIKIARVTRLRLDKIKKDTEALIVGTLEDNNEIYPVLYALNNGKLELLVEYENRPYPPQKKPDDITILLSPVKYVNGSVKPKGIYEILEERLDIAKKLDNILQLGQNLLGSYGLFLLPASLPVDLDELYGEKRVLHLRFIFEEPFIALNILESKNPNVIKKTPPVYAGLIYEHVTLMSSFIIPYFLSPLSPLPLYITRDEAYYLADPKGLGDNLEDFMEFLKVVEDADYHLRIVVDDENVKNPVYRVKAKTDEYVDGKKPAVVAFGIELSPKEFVEALEFSKNIKEDDVGRFKRYGGLLRKKLVTRDKIDWEFRTKLSESILRNQLVKYKHLRDFVRTTLTKELNCNVPPAKELRPRRTLIEAINAFLQALKDKKNLAERTYQLFVAAQRAGILQKVQNAINLADEKSTRMNLENIKKEAYARIIVKQLDGVKGNVQDLDRLERIIAVASRLAELRWQG